MEKSESLLIIHDEESGLEPCIQVLKAQGFNIAMARNTQQGIEIYKKFKPDLIIVDMMMPGMTSFDVLDWIRENDPTVVLVVTTGFATVNIAVKAMKKGAYDFLVKPFSPEELRLTVRQGLDKRKHQNETSKLRREREALQVQFAAIISHELKSPLGAVQQNLFSIVKDLADRLNGPEKARLVRLQQRLDDLMNLIRTWNKAINFDFSRIKDDFSLLSIPDVINRAVEVVQPTALRKGIDIKTDTHTERAKIFGNFLMLEGALVNILNNAVKYTPMNGHIWVKNGTEIACAWISIQDDGVGIPAEDLPHIFEDFFSGKFQVDNSSSRGVGLALTRRIIDVHGGSIDVKSKPREGSKFAIRLPLAANKSDKETVPFTDTVFPTGDPDGLA